MPLYERVARRPQEQKRSRIPRSFSKPSRYGNAAGRIMVHESTLLKREQIGRMTQMDFAGAMRVLMETVYGSYLQGAQLSHEVEEGLMRFLADEYSFLDEISRGTLVARFMHLKYDFHNLRALLKRHYFADGDAGATLEALGTVPLTDMLDAIEGRRPTRPLPDQIQRVIEIVGAATGDEPDPQRIDSIVDREFLEERLEIAEEEGSQLLVAFCQASIDLANLRIVLRGHRLDKGPGFYEEALARGGQLSRGRLAAMAVEPFETVTDRLLESRYGRMLEPSLTRSEGRIRLTTLDRESDEYLLEQVRLFRQVSVGPERIVKYMLTRENEVAMLRVILMGKLHGLTPEAITRRMPAAYLYDESGR